MSINLEAFIGGTTTLLAVPLTWYLTSLTAARANADADRTRLQGQADQLTVAVAEVQAAAHMNQQLRETGRQRLSTFVLAGLAAAGGAARVDGSDLRKALAGGGDLARLLAGERHVDFAAAFNLLPLMGRVAAAAAPLMRHQDAEVARTADRVMEAVRGAAEDAEPLRAALEAFGAAVRAATAPPARRLWWRGRDRP